MEMKADIGIIGGTGLYSIASGLEEIKIESEYGATSGPVSLGTLGGKSIAFMLRHGKNHALAPHKVPYKANIAALKSLGASRIIATSTVGSLTPEYKPGDLVFFDQFVNMTSGRDDTFFHSHPVSHVSMAEPYCQELRRIASDVASNMGLSYHEKGTVVVINGPRFSTKAESLFFGRQGMHVINMTQYPEVALAREREICYLGIGVVTDYDAGLEGRSDIKPVSMAEINKMFAANLEKVKKLISELVPLIPEERSRCDCSKAMANAAVD
jgi:5'-methylthioadenosine phosphorylase